jgi:hypothetical protein
MIVRGARRQTQPEQPSSIAIESDALNREPTRLEPQVTALMCLVTIQPADVLPLAVHQSAFLDVENPRLKTGFPAVWY